ncbi:MAG TPA: DNA cytosine methyltransferase, partial [Vicinamibacteria bacterium]
NRPDTAGGRSLGSKRPRVVSLFSGAMGLDIGLEQAGAELILAVDVLKEAIETARLNRPRLSVAQADLRSTTGPEIRRLASLESEDEIDVLAGGPPCQSFSTAGRRRALDDTDRGPLLFEFVRLLSELQPRCYVLENVPGLLSASSRWRPLPYNNNGKRIDEHHGSLFRELSERIGRAGYSVAHAQLSAADFGVPQTRTRVFVVGFRDGREFEFPSPSHCKDGSAALPPWRTLGDALEGLADDDSPCATFSDRKRHFLAMVPPGGNWRDLPPHIQEESMGKAFFAKGGRSGFWRRLAFERPSPTILTEPQNASTSLCHPEEDRPLSVRECARIQTFPDDWEFLGSRSAQYKLVGNAVPPRLAHAVGKALLSQLARPRLLAAA